MCATTEWTGWSDCSTTCGKGYELRTRRFLNRMGRKKCPHVETMDRRNCAGATATCPEPEEEMRIMANPDCAVTSWSEWSPCSVSCGKINKNWYHILHHINDLIEFQAKVWKCALVCIWCLHSSKQMSIARFNWWRSPCAKVPSRNALLTPRTPDTFAAWKKRRDRAEPTIWGGILTKMTRNVCNSCTEDAAEIQTTLSDIQIARKFAKIWIMAPRPSPSTSTSIKCRISSKPRNWCKIGTIPMTKKNTVTTQISKNRKMSRLANI